MIAKLFNYLIAFYIEDLMEIIFVWFLKYLELIYLKLSKDIAIREFLYIQEELLQNKF